MGRQMGASPYAIISIVMVCSDRPFFIVDWEIEDCGLRIADWGLRIAGFGM